MNRRSFFQTIAAFVATVFAPLVARVTPKPTTTLSAYAGPWPPPPPDPSVRLVLPRTYEDAIVDDLCRIMRSSVNQP